MTNPLRYGAILIAVVASPGLAAGQASTGPAAGGTAPAGASSQPSQITLSPAQRIAILNAVLRNSAKIAAPIKFAIAVGGPVPPSTELFPLPSNAMPLTPELQSLKYTMAQNQVVLVDTITMRVIDVIRQ